MSLNVKKQFKDEKDVSSKPFFRLDTFFLINAGKIVIVAGTLTVALVLLFSFHVISIPSFLLPSFLSSGGQQAGYADILTNDLTFDQGNVYDLSGDLYTFRSESGLVGPVYHANQTFDLQAAAYHTAINDGVLYLITLPAHSSNNSRPVSTLMAIRLSDQKVLWQYSLEQEAGSAPVVKDGIVYAGGSRGDVPYLFALRAVDGTLIWQYKGQYADTFEHGSFETATVDQNTVYVGTSAEQIVALNAQDGMLLWQRQFPADSHSSITKPVLLQTALYVGVDNTLYSLRASDGQTVWQKTTDGKLQKVVSNGLAIYGQSDTAVVSAWKPESGASLWQQQIGNRRGETPSLLVINNLVYAAAVRPSAINAAAIDGYIVALHADNGMTAWEYNVGIQLLPVLATDGQAIYIAPHEEIYALHLQTGQVIWKAKVQRS